MYFHLGQDYILNDRDVIGIFDMDTTTVSARTRKFLRLADSEGAVIDLGGELPKSFVVTDFPVQTVFISPISARTLQRRCERIENMDQYQRGGAL